MKKLAFMAVAIGLGAAALLVSHQSQAADHLDAPAASSEPMADIADVYAWMTSDGNKVNLVMTLSPADPNPPTRMFGPSVQYVFHVTSYVGADNVSAFGTPGTETKVICTFVSDNQAQCWVAQGSMAKDYITGNPSATAGITSKSGKIKMFAGQRSDPFFFNLEGFKKTQATVESVAAGLMFNAAGCPSNVAAATTGALRGFLSTPCTGAQCPASVCPHDTATPPNYDADCFAKFNVKAIVLQIDKSLLNLNSNHLLSVWGSTHAAP